VIFKVTFPEAKEITVQEMTTIKNDMGEVIVEDWLDNGMPITGEIWPLKSNYEHNEMGVTANSTHKLFTTDAIKSNVRLIGINSNIYLTGYIQDWGSHKEVILELIL